MKKFNFLNIALILTFAAFLPSCNQGGSSSEETSEAEVLPENIVEMRGDQIQVAGIQLGSIEKRTLRSDLKVSGIVTVSPQNMATVSIPLEGFISSTSLIPGSPVHKGQVLAVVESQDFLDLQEKYLETRNRLEFMEADYKRHSTLYKEDVYSEKNLQQVTSDYKTLKVQARALEEKLELAGVNPSVLNEDNITYQLKVTSPISGYIRAVNINIGKHISPTDVMFEIVNSDNLMLELTLFDKDADKVREGQTINFFINNEAESHAAKVIQTARAIGEDKTFKVFASVTEECENVLPGMYVNAIVETSGSEVSSLPSDAVVSFDDKDYIFIFERDKEESGQPFTEYRMIEITKGVSDDGYTEIVLAEGVDLNIVRIVVKGAYNLLAAKKNAGEMAC
jgi:membrane fusion protein, heavy metal efflux system